MNPPGEYADELYTEVILAFLGHSLDNGLGEGPFEVFMEEALGGADFERCSIGHVKRIGGSFYALYINKDSVDPRMHFLKFSALEKDELPETGREAVIELLDGTRILVEIDLLSSGSAPGEYAVSDKEELIMEHEITQLVLNGRRPNRATDIFFTGAGFQDAHLGVFCSICNRLVDAYTGKHGDRDSIKNFLKDVKQNAAHLSENPDVSRAVQLMAGQALTIISWDERKIGKAGSIRLSSINEKMAQNDKRGKSYIDSSSLPEAAQQVKQEGAPGFYWRGIEGVAKLGDNLPGALMYDRKHYEKVQENVVMYLMDHGFYPVPEGILHQTRLGRVSTIHETYFLNDLLPGSFQTTSTGAGHFQGTKLDIKCVTEGEGIQVNVRYDARGNIDDIVAQRVRTGDWTLALPGYVDYMINLGGLRFNDVSVDLEAEEASLFNPDFDFTRENLDAVAEVLKTKGKTAPYLAARIGDETYLLKNHKEAPDARWLASLSGYSRGSSLTDIYVMFSEEALGVTIPKLAESFNKAMADADSTAIPQLTDEVLGRARVPEAPSLGRSDKITELVDSNAGLLRDQLASSSGKDVLIRIPVEALEAAGPDLVKGYLSALQDSGHVYIELYSSLGPGSVTGSKYAEYGIEKKNLPEGFTSSRENTITLFTVMKAEEITARGKSDGDWGLGGIMPTETIISPVGLNYDRSGFIRGIILGLKLSLIARQKSEQGKVDAQFVERTLKNYRDFCWSQGVRDFHLKPEDLVDLATGDINRTVRALNRIIKALPIMPLNTEEIREIYEHAREALIRA
ncbi:MAG: hypothetical protein GF409_01420 [Candidatus Omnitrophica bacterium]|nr:hypothetical protein [Candidatus Omnitrophota bacterium]